MISACCSLSECEMVSGKSKIKMFLFSLSSATSFFATASGIQLLLKLYLAMVWLFLRIESSSFSIFSSKLSPSYSLYANKFICVFAIFSFSSLFPQLLTALKTSYAPSFSKAFPISFKVLNLQLMLARISWMYLTPSLLIPQKLNESFSILAFCRNPRAKLASPSFFISLSSILNLMMLFLSFRRVLPRNSQPNAVILFYMRSKYSTVPTLSM